MERLAPSSSITGEASIEKQTSNRLIILGGCPRSGTTLVQNMLDSHPEILGGPEFLHLVDIVRLRGQLQISVAKEWIDLFCSAAEVDAQIRTLTQNLLLPLAKKNGAKFLSEKSPDNVKVLAELAELFPGAKIVHIVRDPRAVIASLLAAGRRATAKGEKPATFTRNAHAAIRYVSRCLKAGFRASEAHPDQIYTLLYERLVVDPEGESKKLCQFLELDWSPALLNPAGQKHLGEAAITVNSQEIWYDKSTYYSNPNTERLTAWQQELSAHEQILANREFNKSKQLTELGYQFSDNTLGPFGQIVGKARAFPTLVKHRIIDRAYRIIENYRSP